MRIAYIYKITSPSGKIYIGQTLNYIRRRSRYRNLQCADQPKLYNSILKYGFENHTFEILKECSEEDVDSFEVSFINEFNSIKAGLNCREGGKIGFKNSDETLEKIRLKNLGRKHTTEAKNKIGLANSGNTYCLGRVLSDKTRIKMSNSHKGKHENSKRKVQAISKDGETFNFDSITDATIFVNKTVESAPNICAALKGRLKTAFGYKWNYI